MTRTTQIHSLYGIKPFYKNHFDFEITATPSKLTSTSIITSSIETTASLAARTKSEWDACQKMAKKLLDLAKENLNTNFSECIAKNPSFIPDRKDIDFAMKNLGTYFAIGLAKNPNYNPTTDEIKKFKLNQTSSAFLGYVVGKSSYVPDKYDINFAISNQDTLFAFSIGMNENYIPSKEHIGVTQKRRCFAYGVASNKNFHPEQENIDLAKYHFFDIYLSKNSNFRPSKKDIDFAYRNPCLDFSIGLFQNPNFTPQKRFIDLALKNPHENYAFYIAKALDPDLRINTFGRADRRSKFYHGLVLNKRFFPNEEDLNFARENPNDLFTGKVSANSNFIPTLKDLEKALKDHKNPFAEGIASNPNLFLPREIRAEDLQNHVEHTGYKENTEQIPSIYISNDTNFNFKISENDLDKMTERQALLRLLALSNSNKVNFSRNDLTTIKTTRDIAWARIHTNDTETISIVTQEDFHPTKEDIEIARANPYDPFAYILRNKNYIPTNEDLKFAYINPDCQFTWNLLLNPNIEMEN